MSVRVVAAVVVAGAHPSDAAADELAAALDRHRAIGAVLITGPPPDPPGLGQTEFWPSAGPADFAARVDADVLLLHPVSGPCPPAAVIDDVLAAVAAGAGAAIPVIPMSDTVKLIDGDGFVVGGEDRDRLRVWQWPWAFRRDQAAGLLGSWADWACGASFPAGAALVPVAERPPSGRSDRRAMIVP